MRLRLLPIVTAAAWAAIAPAASATDPATRFNAPGQKHADACLPLAVGSAPLRYADSTPTGFTLTSDMLHYDIGACPGGTATLDLHEVIPSAAGPLAFHRGGSGYVDRGNVKYGELAASDLGQPLPPPVPASGGRGAPCTLANEPPYQVTVRAITSRMHYKRGGGASYVPYGDPAADQGENDGTIHYTYLLWSWINVSGGGTVRTLLAQGQVVRACDVEPVTSPAYDADGNVNGQVTARYVRTLAGSCPVYGWMVWSHTYFGNSQGPLAHAAVASTPPPPDPAPDPACPVAEPASAPIVSTGQVVGTRSGPTFTGLVNPKGVPTTYLFQFGTSTGYGQSTPAATLSSLDQDVTAPSRPVALRPGRTYHYRLVAANTHGVTYGSDETVVPPSLTGLRVKPATFAHARKKGGKAAQIRFNLSAPATVTIRFLRKQPGVRRGRSCKPAGKHASGKGCTRQVVVPGSLRRRFAGRGRKTLSFSGWVGSRKLAPGRYVAGAQPLGSAGVAGLARTFSFRVR